MTNVNGANTTPPVTGVVLAGGIARRMGGGDKCLRTIAGRSLLERVIERAARQTAPLLLNANGPALRFADFGLPIVADVVVGYAGPLAGILTALEWAKVCTDDCHWVASFASDTPFFPDDLVNRMVKAVETEGTDIACASSGGRTHPVFGLWPVSLANDLRWSLTEESIRKIDTWTARYRVSVVEFETTPFDPFFNVNTPGDLHRAESIAGLTVASQGKGE